MEAIWLDDETPIEASALDAEGVLYERMDLGAHDAPLAALMEARGYVERDEVALSPATEGLDAICAKFSPEHTHDDDEVRFVLEGEGIFDIRSRDDRWMRVTVYPGDLIVVPAGRNHRFELTSARAIRCVRLFKDRSGWVPRYREEQPASPA